MKNIALCLFAACIISCSGDNETKTISPQANFKEGDVQPANSDNPYEDAGQMFSEIFDSYYDGSTLPTTISGISERVNSIALQNTKFNSLKGTGYSPTAISRIEYINSRPSTCVQDVVNNLGLSTAAKTSLSQFINGVCTLSSTESEYGPIYTYITAYEASVMSNTNLTNHDKEVILCTTSISRYSAYKPRKRPKRNTDPEWAILLTHITGGSDGADLSVCHAVSESMTLGIIGNE